jgi:putative transposase
MKRTKSTE